MAELFVDDDFRCSVWTAAQGFDPIGSATRFDRLVTVEVPPPWPPKIEQMEWIAPLDVPAGTRVQAIVAEAGRIDGTVLLTRWERRGAVLEGTDWLVSAGDVPDGLRALVAGGEADGEVAPAPPEVLICGHGTRDRCCGGVGTRLAVEARAALGGMRVRRTSHLGGHRYAPTAVTLPDGRMWAHLDAESLAGIVHRTLHPSEARDLYRGNPALDPWAQVVEGALLEEQGWPALDLDEVGADVEVHGQRASVDLRWSGGGETGQRHAEVEITTRYPVLQCGLPPSEAEKDAPEYRLV